MVEISKEELDRLKPMPNMVLVKMVKTSKDKNQAFDNIKTIKGIDGNIELEIDTSYEPNWKASVRGIVTKVCNKLTFDEMSNSAFDPPWDTDVEIKEGDLAYYEYTAITRAFGIGNSDEMYTAMSCEGNLYLFMKYHEIFLVKREDQIIPVNGYVVGLREEKEKVESALVVERLLKTSDHIINVKYVGKPNRAYRGYTHKAAAKQPGLIIPTYDFTEHNLVPGENVFVDKASNIFLIENDINPTLEKGLVCTQRKYIGAVTK